MTAVSCLNDITGSQPDNPKFKRISVNDLYELSVPAYMNATDDLNEEASLQQMQIFKEVYVIVLDEDKQEFIDIYRELDMYNDSLSVAENYKELQMGFLEEQLTINRVYGEKSVEANGMDLEMVRVEGSYHEVPTDIVYSLGYAEGEDMIYTIMAWTLESRKDKYGETLDKIVSSIKEL